MKTARLFLLILLLAIINHCYSQNDAMHQVESIKQTGKDAMVARALELIDSKIDPALFNISILESQNEIHVRFSQPARYVPFQSRARYDVSVMLIQQTVSYNTIANPDEYEGSAEPRFYVPTKDDMKNYLFVVRAIRKNNGTDITTLPEGTSATILEKSDYFQVIVVSDEQESRYKTDKISGKVYDEEHAHLVPPPPTDKDHGIIFNKATFPALKSPAAPVDIQELIAAKAHHLQQQEILRKFSADFAATDRISAEEFRGHYRIIVSHPAADGYSGGTECYEVDKNTGSIKMIWHEHPVKIKN